MTAFLSLIPIMEIISLSQHFLKVSFKHNNILNHQQSTFQPIIASSTRTEINNFLHSVPKLAPIKLTLLFAIEMIVVLQFKCLRVTIEWMAGARENDFIEFYSVVKISASSKIQIN